MEKEKYSEFVTSTAKDYDMTNEDIQMIIDSNPGELFYQALEVKLVERRNQPDDLE